LTDT